HLSVHLSYAKDPSSLSKRFPFIESLALKGLPYWNFLPHISATPWIEGIYLKFDCLKALHIRGLIVFNEDLGLFSKTRGKDLRSLKIYNCQGFFEKGLLHISQYCNDLTSLCLEDNGVEEMSIPTWKSYLQMMYVEIWDLRVIGRVCKKLRKLAHDGEVTHTGLIALVQGCTNLEYIDVTLLDISNATFECVGTHLKNLRDFHMDLFEKANIRLLELSKGCPRLRKLYFYFWIGPLASKLLPHLCLIYTLRYIWLRIGFEDDLVLTRPTFTVEVLTELTQYATLAEKLHKLTAGLKILPKLARFLKSKDETDENDASKQALLDELKRLEVHPLKIWVLC
nr:hypothetical protein [Tanacetum cinerariifolium]